MRTDDFKQDRPEDRVKRNLSPGGQLIRRAQSQPPLQQKQHRQRARHQQHIIEMVVHEPAMRVRFDEPAVQRIKRTAEQAEGVANVPEFFHSSAKITNPKAIATSSLYKRIMSATLPGKAAPCQKFI
jgi:hypothetical protein